MARLGMTMAVAGALLTAASGSVHAAPPPDHGPAIDLPLDVEGSPAALDAAPSNDDMQRHYPRLAMFMGLGGAATMTCATLPSGRLQDCRLVSETPEGLGFGAATLQTAQYFRVTPAKRNGVPIEGSITIPLRWATPYHPSAAPAAPSVAPAANLALARQIMQLRRTSDRLQSSWSPLLAEAQAALPASGDATAGRRVEDAMSAGLTDAVAADVERKAEDLAAQVCEADLRATVVFLQSPAGQAWTAADTRADGVAKDMNQWVGAAARAHFCAQESCL